MEVEMNEEVRVKTDLRTLKSAWNLLKEMNIDGLLTGGSVNLDVGQLITQLLIEGKLNEFCRIVTGSDADFEGWEIDAVLEVVARFFQGITGALNRLTESRVVKIGRTTE